MGNRKHSIQETDENADRRATASPSPPPPPNKRRRYVIPGLLLVPPNAHRSLKGFAAQRLFWLPWTFKKVYPGKLRRNLT